MGISGDSIRKTAFKIVKLDGDRVLLAKHLVANAKQSPLEGVGEIPCLLLVVRPGRYRLLTKEGDELSKILNKAEEAGLPGDEFTLLGSDSEAAIRARLIPCMASGDAKGWRVTLPKEAIGLIPEGEERLSVYVMLVAGYIEFWFPDTLQRAVSGPVADLLS